MFTARRARLAFDVRGPNQLRKSALVEKRHAAVVFQLVKFDLRSQRAGVLQQGGGFGLPATLFYQRNGRCAQDSDDDRQDDGVHGRQFGLSVSYAANHVTNCCSDCYGTASVRCRLETDNSATIAIPRTFPNMPGIPICPADYAEVAQYSTIACHRENGSDYPVLSSVNSSPR